MIHWWSFFAGIVAAFLGSTLLVFAIMVWEARPFSWRGWWWRG